MTQQQAANTIDAGRQSPMSGATLKTIREALGLSVPWFAQFCSVQERTVRHWESGRNTVPIKVGEAILTLEGASLELSDSIVSQVRAITATHGKPDGSVPIVRYADDQDLARCQPNMKGLPATFHAAAIARARWELAGEVEVVAQMFGAVPQEGDTVILKRKLGVSKRYRIIATLDSYPAIRYQGVPLDGAGRQIGRVETFSLGDIDPMIEP
jgi:hypothetical protein